MRRAATLLLAFAVSSFFTFAQTPLDDVREAFAEGEYGQAASLCELYISQSTDQGEVRLLETFLTMCQDCGRLRDDAERLYQGGYLQDALDRYSRLLSLNPEDQLAIGRYRIVTDQLEREVLMHERALAVTENTARSFDRFIHLYPEHPDVPAMTSMMAFRSGRPAREADSAHSIAAAQLYQEYDMAQAAEAILSWVAPFRNPEVLFREALLGTDAMSALYVYRNSAAFPELAPSDPEANLRRLIPATDPYTLSGNDALELARAAIELGLPAMTLMDAAAMQRNTEALEWMAENHPQAEERAFIRKAILSGEFDPYYSAWLQYLKGAPMQHEDWALMAEYLRRNEPDRREEIFLALALAVKDNDGLKVFRLYASQGRFSSGIQALALSMMNENGRNRWEALARNVVRDMRNIRQGPYRKPDYHYLPLV